MAGWDEDKLALWRRLWEDLEIGYLDEDALPVIVELFARPKAYTSSSCSGRITVIDAEYPWRKDDATIVYKVHRPLRVEELRAVMERPYRYRLWLSVQGPIYHVYVKDLEEANEVLEAAREAGFKHSGVMVASGDRLLLELRTGIRVAAPLIDRDAVYVADLDALVRLANRALVEAKERNVRLLEALRARRPKTLWEPAVSRLR